MTERKNTLLIDHQEISFEAGQTILEIAEEADIYIPRLCYLKELEPFGACRLCIVKVKDMEGYIPACSTPAKDGMEIITKNEELQGLRREVLKLILSEHPYACLTCENKEECEETRRDKIKAGTMFGCFSCAKKEECELCQLVDYLDLKEIDFPLDYKDHPVKKEDPFFDRDYNLCVLCGRCVRTCNELRGVGAINFINRGDEIKVSTALDVLHINSSCQFCGACVDVCPTGALTPKNTKWVDKDTEQISSACGFCSVGCDFTYYYDDGTLVESIPAKKNGSTLGQACVVGRFCTPQVIGSQERLDYPMIRKKETLIPVDWESVIRQLGQKLANIETNSMAFVASPFMTNESAYLLKKIAAQLNIKNITINANLHFIKAYYNFLHTSSHLLQRFGFRDIPNSDTIFLINTNIQETHPVLQVHLKRAKNNGAKIFAINFEPFSQSVELKRLLTDEFILNKSDLLELFIALTKELLNSLEIQDKDISNLENIDEFKAKFENLDLSEENTAILTTILHHFRAQKADRKVLSIMGHFSDCSTEYYETLLGLISNFRIFVPVLGLLPLWRETNLEGVYQILAQYLDVMERNQIFDGITKGKITDLYTFQSIQRTEVLEKVEFLITQTPFDSEISESSDIMIPANSFAEDEGTFLNSGRRLQAIHTSQNLDNQRKKDWRILEDLRQQILKAQTEETFQNPEAVLDQITQDYPNFSNIFDSREDLDSSFNIYVPADIKKIEMLSNSASTLSKFENFDYRGRKITEEVPDFKQMIEFRSEKGAKPEESETAKENIDYPYKIHTNYEIVPNFYKLTIEAPLIANKAKPGNFLIIMTTERSERIPLTISDWDRSEGTITVYYQEAGFSTKELKNVKEGSSIYSVVGPLGKEIEIKKYGTVLLGGGCYGIGGIYPIAKALKSMGNRILILLESKNELLFYLQDKFQEIADDLYYCTADGSKGIKGKVTRGLDVIFQEHPEIDCCYFIGCKHMMRDASEFTKKQGKVPTFVSLNTIMIDGTGMCGGCRLSLIKEGEIVTKFACVDGPAFDGHLIKWDELIERTKQFTQPEKMVYQQHSCKALEELKRGDSDE
ncbi:MAG: sulfide/dihydroorotate dehydrogenase-like FAD/NAD-binding protein [Promethearchaeia archaeon]